MLARNLQLELQTINMSRIFPKINDANVSEFFGVVF